METLATMMELQLQQRSLSFKDFALKTTLCTVTDVAAGCVKIVTGLSGTIEFLKNLGSLYNSFGIHAKGAETTHISPHDAPTNVSNICSYFKNTVTDVKETKRIAGVTNGPEGTISAKTKVSLELLHSGMESLV